MIAHILASASILATPILLAALGGLINRRGGIINIGLEGKMLVGAFVAVLVSAATGGWMVAVLAGGLAGLLIGLLFSWSVTRLGANEIVAGLGLNILLAGLVGFLLQRIWGVSATLRLDITRIPRINIPVLESVPYLGPILSGNDPVTYLAWLLVPLTAFALANTRWGIRVRATGAAGDAVRALGLPMLRIRDASTAVAGLLAGMAGAHLALGLVGLFSRHMVAGRGFIALAAFYFGRARPLATTLAVALFAVFDATQIRLQGRGVPPQLVQMLPYIVVILVLAIAGIRAQRARTRRLVTV